MTAQKILPEHGSDALDLPERHRTGRVTAITLAIVAVALGGCRARSEFSLRDTEGWAYRASCDTNDCVPTLDSPHPARARRDCAAGSQPGFVLAGQRVIVACQGCVGAATSRTDVATCRALACNDDRDCPPRHAKARTRCVRGLCQVPSQPTLDPAAAAGLCMTGAGPSGLERPLHLADRLALAGAACDPQGHCHPPAGCREP